jgi:indole-3-glycerol phosphate synthase
VSPEPVGDFLDLMARSSAARAAELRSTIGESELLQRAQAMEPPVPLRRSAQRFDLIAEIKLASPSEGALADGPANIADRGREYAAAGACAISVLTEPTRFGGDNRHLAEVAQATAPLGVPVMAKDFFTDATQLCAARLAGAGGALLILRMLDDETLIRLVALCEELGMFVLVEAFDRDDLDRAAKLFAGSVGERLLMGLNTRDLSTLRVDPERLAELATCFPGGFSRVAESGIASVDDVAGAATLGYDMALVGTALMRSPQPGGLVSDMLATGRRIRSGEET